MIVLILILAFILRLINLNQSLWLDEAVQAITAQNSFSYIFQEITGDFHPPLYYFLLHSWVRIFGSSEIALRIPSVLFGVGTVFILYKLTMHMHGRFVAILSAVLLATAPFHIYYSQEARMYSMVTFFATLSMFYFIKILTKSIFNQQPSSKFKVQSFDYLLYFLTTLLMIYSDYYGFLVLLAQDIYLIMRKRYRFLLIANCLLLVAFIPWLPMFIKQIKTGMLATQMLPGWGKLVNVSFLKAIPLTLIKFTIGRITIFNKIIYGIVSLLIFGLVGLVGGYGIVCSKFKVQSPVPSGTGQSSKLQFPERISSKFNGAGKVQNFNNLIFLWFFVPLIVSWLASLFVPNYQPFRLLLILPSFCLLLAMGIKGLPAFAKASAGKGGIRGVAIATFLIINLVSLSVYYFNSYFHREDWRSLVKYLQDKKDSTAILPSSASNWPIKYYDPEGKIKLTEGIVGVGEIKEIREIKEDKVYYIRYLVPLFDPNGLILANIEDQGYTKINEISFNQIPIWEFRK